MPAMRVVILFSIRMYQRTLSPDHGWLRILFPDGCCRFYPSCSEYARQSISRYGWRGLWSVALRLARCHPWSAGGLDPVTPQPTKVGAQGAELRVNRFSSPQI